MDYEFEISISTTYDPGNADMALSHFNIFCYKNMEVYGPYHEADDSWWEEEIKVKHAHITGFIYPEICRVKPWIATDAFSGDAEATYALFQDHFEKTLRTIVFDGIDEDKYLSYADAKVLADYLANVAFNHEGDSLIFTIHKDHQEILQAFEDSYWVIEDKMMSDYKFATRSYDI